MARARRLDDEDDFDDRPRRPRRDDDEDGDRPRPSRRTPPPSQAPKILAIVGGVFVVLALICAGVGLYIWNSVTRGVNEVQQNAFKMAQQAQEEHAKSVERTRAEQAKAQAAEAASDRGQAKAKGEAFAAELIAGRVAAAYQMTSPDFRRGTPARKAVSEAQLAALVAKYEAFPRSRPQLRASAADPAKGTEFTFEGSVGANTMRVWVKMVDGQWLIDHFWVV